MKIQEMRSGSLHLNKKLEDARREKLYLVPHATPAQEEAVPLQYACELDEAVWSVVSFDQREAGGLTYDQAESTMSELNSLEVPGLCIVTGGAATRIPD